MVIEPLFGRLFVFLARLQGYNPRIGLTFWMKVTNFAQCLIIVR